MANYGCDARTTENNKSNPESLNMIDMNHKKINSNKMKSSFKNIIIDFKMVNFVDENGVKCLQKILNEYKKEGVKILFTNVNCKFLNERFSLVFIFNLKYLYFLDSVREFFVKMNCKWDEYIYVTIRDAIILNSM